MATMIGCPSCGKSIPPDAIVCPYCANAILTAVPKKKAGMGCLTAVGGIVALVVVVNLLPKDKTQEAIERADAQQLEAFLICHQFVTKRLRSPSSADFASQASATIERIPDDNYDVRPYRVRSYVDSQNAFGAMLRTNFTCIVAPQGGRNWKLVDLQTDSQ